jgi:hypothetical protein
MKSITHEVKEHKSMQNKNAYSALRKKMEFYDKPCYSAKCRLGKV